MRTYSKESPEQLMVFLENAIVECKNELATTDLETKAMAVLKLAYLEMYGFDMSWCNFQVLEVMLSSKFQQKRIGYLGAIQLFRNEQDLLILATNQFKKDLNSHNHVEVGLALSGIATIVTPNLAKDIYDDVVMKLNHSKPYIRKKAILALYKVFLQYPDSLRMSLQRIIDKLDDNETSVVNAAINVVCEISKKNPKIFVAYLPKFFLILEDTKNNWLIIRILKLFQSLSKVETRMRRKILPAIVDMMMSTKASSLIYECINCIVSGGMLTGESSKDKDIARKCIEKIINFFQNGDNNLKFVGLLALINILKLYPQFIRSIPEVSPIVLDCLTDRDSIIQSKALEIAQYLINEDNINEVFKVLLIQLIPLDDRLIVPDKLKVDIITKIIDTASQDNYSNIPNFKWYIAVLQNALKLTVLSGNYASRSAAITIAKAFGKEFTSLATKVPSIRRPLATLLLELAEDPNVIDGAPLLLKDVYWILGEYVNELGGVDDDDDEQDDQDEEEENNINIIALGKKIKLFNTLINKEIDTTLDNGVNAQFPISAKLAALPNHGVICVVIQSLVKIYLSIVRDYMLIYGKGNKLPTTQLNELQYFLFKLIGFLGNWENHRNYEVQERVISWLEFLRLCLEAMNEGDDSILQKLEQEEIEYYKTLRIGDKKKANEGEDEEEGEEEEDDEEQEEDDEQEVDSSVDPDYEQFSSSSDEDSIEETIKPQIPVEDLLELEEEEKELEKNPFSSQINDIVEDSNMEKPLPVLLGLVLPSFFNLYTLKPVARNAQLHIKVPEALDLDVPINDLPVVDLALDEVSSAYNLFDSNREDSDSLSEEETAAATENSEIMRKERMQRLKEDPYYIDTTASKSRVNKSKSKLVEAATSALVTSPKTSTSPGLDEQTLDLTNKKPKKSKKIKKEKVLVLTEETVDNGGGDEDRINERLSPMEKKKKKKNIFLIDSSTLENFDLNAPESNEEKSGVEYEVNLEEIRQRLEKQALEKAEKTKVKKSKTKTTKSDGDKQKKAKKKKASIIE